MFLFFLLPLPLFALLVIRFLGFSLSSLQNKEAPHLSGQRHLDRFDPNFESTNKYI